MRRLLGFNSCAHQVVGIGRLALDAALAGEGAVGFDYQGRGDAGAEVQAVDVLGEVLKEEAFTGEEGEEGVREGGAVTAGVELGGEGVEGEGVGAEEGDVEDGFGVGEAGVVNWVWANGRESDTYFRRARLA